LATVFLFKMSALRKRNLQYDNLKPFTWGGERIEQNIQLMCSTHNKRRRFKTLF
jgi:hypothetical protein